MKIRLIIYCLIISTILSRAYPNVSADTLKPDFHAVRVGTPVNLSGKLDDPQWLQAIPVELKFEVSPGENTPASQKTVAMVLYDQENIYIGFRCYDSVPESIRANL